MLLVASALSFLISIPSLLHGECPQERRASLCKQLKTTRPAYQKKIYPPPLKKGDCIALVFPASWIPKTWVDACVENLEEQGFCVRLAQNILERWGFLAGSDSKRAKAFTDIWLEPDVNAVWCMAGGYGSGRIVESLDFNRLCQHPKIFIGMSDVTVLHSAFNNYGLVTFLGPLTFQLFSSKTHQEKKLFAKKSLFDLIQATQSSFTWDFSDQEGVETMREGSCRGEITGGNLSLIAAHVGTPWQLRTKDKILVLEDVGEKTYRIDRMLIQLKQAGIFDGLAGLILGTWTNCFPRTSSSRGDDLDLDAFLDDMFENAPYPILKGAPIGHIPDQITLPLGCLAQLNTEEKTLELLESPTAPHLPHKTPDFLYVLAP